MNNNDDEENIQDPEKGNHHGLNSYEGFYPQIVCRGVRGAITVAKNDAEDILAATRKLLKNIMEANRMDPDDIASIYFTTTTDLNATHPALAARQLGLTETALLCGHEMEVPDSLPLCIRILIHWNTTKSAKEIVHIYLRDAVTLRPDRKDLPPIPPRHIESAQARASLPNS